MLDWRNVATVAISLMFSSPADPHGSADWIMKDPAYKGAGEIHCCGPSDCRAVAADFAHPVAGGWYIPSTGQTFAWGAPGLYSSNDGVTLWRCQPTGLPVRCLFVPGQGV